jgi:hypothetical protein
METGVRRGLYPTCCSAPGSDIGFLEKIRSQNRSRQTRLPTTRRWKLPIRNGLPRRLICPSSRSCLRTCLPTSWFLSTMRPPGEAGRSVKSVPCRRRFPNPQRGRVVESHSSQSARRMGHPRSGWRRLTAGFSFAPSGLVIFSCFLPTACAVGCILSPLRGWFHFLAGWRHD